MISTKQQSDCPPQPRRHRIKTLSQLTALSTGLVLLAGAPSHAAAIQSGVFSLWLECNNDGISHIFGSGAPINGWQYTSDARADNTDGYFYDIAGIAVKQVGEEVVVALSGNTPLTGTGFDRQGSQVVWGDLFFTDGSQSFTQAMNTGNLFGVRFAADNESGASQLGVYNNVVGKSVGVNNFGHRTYDNYAAVAGEEAAAQSNFLGDMEASDLSGEDTYFDGDDTGYNVIGQGTKVRNDGFSLLPLDDLLLADFDLSNFAAAGDETIAFKFNQSALQYQPTAQELANELGVEWIWDEQGEAPGDKGFDQLEQELDDAKATSKRINDEEIKPLNRAIEAERQTVEGYAAVKTLNQAGRNWQEAQEKLAQAQAVVDALAPKKAAWDAMTEAEQASAPPEAVWTRKDNEDWAYQHDSISTAQATIDEIETSYSPEELAAAKKTFNAFIKNEMRKHENAEFRENYLRLEAERKEWQTAKKQQDQLAKDLGQEQQALSDYVKSTLESARQEQLTQRLADAEAAAAADKTLEEELGGPRTENSGIPTTQAEFEAAIAPTTDTEPVSVPEPTTMLGTLVALAFGCKAGSRRHRN